MKKSITSIVIALLAVFATSASVAGPVSWSISGPGTISATQNALLDWDLDYYINPAGSGQTWTVSSGPIGQSGDYTFDWNYSGFHAFFNVTAFLNSSTGATLVSAGPNNCCSGPSAGFNYGGSYTFTGLTAGDVIGFTMGGGNGDSNNVLTGTLNLVQTSSVPEPGSMMLLGLGLAMFGFRRRNT